LIRTRVTGIVFAACMVAWVGTAQAITCEECKEIEKNRASVESEISHKETSLKAAFEKKKFHEVTEIQKQIVDLRKSLIELQKKDVGCKDACRPDLVKETECNRLKSQIVKLEEDSPADVEKVDALYRDLATCNKDLARLRKPR
jgi:predicted RNase H-like nuclease (RuvC/YqgF family)